MSKTFRRDRVEISFEKPTKMVVIERTEKNRRKIDNAQRELKRLQWQAE